MKSDAASNFPPRAFLIVMPFAASIFALRMWEAPRVGRGGERALESARSGRAEGAGWVY